MIKIPDELAAILFPSQEPQFTQGQLVRHRRYGYRGVVVDWDASCEAPQAWYQSNQTQPSRGQPWYHVLVHQTQTTTYAAQQNLMPETEPAPIEHPLLDYFFDGYEEGQYLRNDKPWIG